MLGPKRLVNGHYGSATRGGVELQTHDLYNIEHILPKKVGCIIYTPDDIIKEAEPSCIIVIILSIPVGRIRTPNREPHS